jgi:hypothetical protein
VNVPIALLAAETENVEPLGRDRAADRVPHAVNDVLQREVLLEGEVRDHVLPVLPRRNEHVAVQRLEALQERDGELVLVDELVLVVGVAGEELADEAAAREPPPHRFEVDLAPAH